MTRDEATVTCDERRRVAERLRGLNGNASRVRRAYEAEGISIFCDDQADYYQICNAIAGYLPAEHMHPCDYDELHLRLADLIEPPACPARVVRSYAEEVDWHTGESPLVHELRLLADRMERECAPVDRDALLALADDVDGAADDSGGFEPLAGMLRDIARHIREACGEAVA